ncbi:hypothetical protein P171DRAFT_439355 [Karstenula rhodostoma CBS 690.94]|uniref:Uncharacterized protein n=1 Tax=Karstenula rhodostoma CBS 690.94 TaxID=1392251 RepID=A0A9P4PUY7_9PLEO|nr:hypothetical protein P171DRAFT_439355 [Karstenula rhodostoma CBS 690.94]
MNPRSLGPAPPFPNRTSKSKSSQQNRNPFRVSVSRSARYVPRPDSPATTTSPLIGSRIPRKSPGSVIAAPDQAEFLLPSQRSANTHLTKGTTSMDIGSAILQVSTYPNAERDSLVNAHKPLPSPPALQVMNPLNSPRAQRTLIDADIEVTPSSAEWPALSPENVASEGDGRSQDTNTANATAPSFSLAESVSLFEQHELTTGALDHPYGLSTGRHERRAGSSTLPRVKSSQTDSEEDLAPHMIIHALTTPDEGALESPLARKVVVPPRLSSKRAHVPLTVTSHESQMVHTVVTAASRRREARTGDAQWPLLNTDGNNPSGMTSLSESDTCMSNAHGVSESMDTYHNANLRRASTHSASSWSQAAGSSIYDDEPHVEEPGYRTKRISDHSSKSEPGPLLRISDEADSILLGKVPPLPDNTTKSTLRQGSLSTITSRTMSRLSAGVSRSRTHQTITERAATRLSTLGELRPTSDSPWSTPTQKSNVTVRKRSLKVTPKLPMVASASIDQRLATPQRFPNTSRSNTGPRPSPPPPRAEASPGYARSTVASSRNTSMLNQRAVLRKPANSPSRSSELKSEHSETHSKNDSKPSRKSGNQSTGEKGVKPKRSLRNMLPFRDTKEKTPPVPAVPKRSSLLGSAFGGRFKSFPGLHTQRENGETTRRTVPEGQDGNTQPVPPSSAGPPPPATTTPDAVTTVNKIMDQASQLPETSSVRLRGLEIAQVCTALIHRARMLDELILTVQTRQALLASVDACKTAQIAATQARQCARQAELSMQRSAVELGRLFKLCEGDLDEETVQLIKDLLRNAWDSAFPLSPSTASRSTPNPQREVMEG